MSDDATYPVWYQNLLGCLAMDGWTCAERSHLDVLQVVGEFHPSIMRWLDTTLVSSCPVAKVICRVVYDLLANIADFSLLRREEYPLRDLFMRLRGHLEPIR